MVTVAAAPTAFDAAARAEATITGVQQGIVTIAWKEDDTFVAESATLCASAVMVHPIAVATLTAAAEAATTRPKAATAMTLGMVN